MKFNMSVSDNFASFFDDTEDNHIFVDSFDNENFDVRIGSIDESELVGTIHAETDEDLNHKILELYKGVVGEKQ